MQYLTLWDFLLTPVFLLLFTAVAKRIREKRYPVGHPLRTYYMPGLYVKFFGAVFIALVYQYYYGGGDTFNFFQHTQVINSSLQRSFGTWVKLVTRQPVEGNPELYDYAMQMNWYDDPASYSVAAIGAVFGVLCGTNYLPIAVMFAYFSFTGIWAMYRTFANLYPNLHKEMAIAFLFIPSTFVWGSAIFKDTVCMFGLGWLTYTTFGIIVRKDFSIKNLFMLALSFYLISIVKLYILLAFLPALSLWLLLTYSHKIKSVATRWIVNILFICITIGGFFLLSQQFAAEMQKYSLEKVAETAATTRGWIGYVSDVQEGSGYDLGEFDATIGGMLTKFPQAVVVTLFRPFIWEVKKVIVALSAIEALVFLYFTLKIFLSSRGKAFRWIANDPTILFCLIFTLIFAFAVGITSYNFGALSRYKIPCMPFYTAFLFLLMAKQKAIKESQPTQKRELIKTQLAM